MEKSNLVVMMKRRSLLKGAMAIVPAGLQAAPNSLDMPSIERVRVMADASKYLSLKPVTVTATRSARSAGGLNDFFSEGDYWWPDPKGAELPYVRRDGMTNPANFVEHRNLLMRVSQEVPALAAASVLSRNRRYAAHAAAHLRAWFLTPETRMNPSLQYAQAIQGRSTGRGTGIIDTIHFVEVAKAIPLIAKTGALTRSEFAGIQGWFASYLDWMTTSKNGIEERDTKNNHATCWVMQVAAFAELTGNQKLMADCANRFKTLIVPEQIGTDGSQPLEMSRTKPYGYCLFNLDALTTLCQIVSKNGEDLWKFETADGRGIRKAIEFLYPFIADKKKWKLPPDVMYFDEWPMRHTSLLFGALAYGRKDYLDLWKKLPANSKVDEVIRNFFIRQPLLWT